MAEIAGLVLAGINTSGKLLECVLRAKLTWREFRQNEATVRNLEDDLQLFEFATSTVNKGITQT
jgi:hypothetical protein